MKIGLFNSKNERLGDIDLPRSYIQFAERDWPPITVMLPSVEPCFYSGDYQALQPAIRKVSCTFNRAGWVECRLSEECAELSRSPNARREFAHALHAEIERRIGAWAEGAWRAGELLNEVREVRA